MKELLNSLTEAENHAVRLVSDGDIVEVCRLTCLEHESALTHKPEAPALVVDGLDI